MAFANRRNQQNATKGPRDPGFWYPEEQYKSGFFFSFDRGNFLIKKQIEIEEGELRNYSVSGAGHLSCLNLQGQTEFFQKYIALIKISLLPRHGVAFGDKKSPPLLSNSRISVARNWNLVNPPHLPFLRFHKVCKAGRLPHGKNYMELSINLLKWSGQILGGFFGGGGADCSLDIWQLSFFTFFLCIMMQKILFSLLSRSLDLMEKSSPFLGWKRESWTYEGDLPLIWFHATWSCLLSRRVTFCVSPEVELKKSRDYYYNDAVEKPEIVTGWGRPKKSVRSNLP